MEPPETCPQCGAEVPRTARACPECGSDKQTGWSEAAQAQRLDLPDDGFDYDEFVREEFGEESRVRPRGVRRLWWGVAALILALIALGIVLSFRR